MRNAPILLALAALLAPAARAGDLDLAARSGGAGHVTVPPGATVSYEIVAELADASTGGLALVVFDLSFEGGPLAPSTLPPGDPMQRFASPLGLNNPAGFGGTPQGGALLQVGGAQNTIQNSFAPKPAGAVLAGVAMPGSPVVVAKGTLVAPTAVGDYRLRITGLEANALDPASDGNPFWRVVELDAGAIGDLVVEVRALSADVATLSISAGGVQTLILDAGVGHAGRPFLLLGSKSGTSPGLAIGPGLVLPLNGPDSYLSFTAANPNHPPLTNSFGLLGPTGRSRALFTLPPASSVSLIGATVDHAFLTFAPLDFASNPVPLVLGP